MRGRAGRADELGVLEVAMCDHDLHEPGATVLTETTKCECNCPLISWVPYERASHTRTWEMGRKSAKNLYMDYRGVWHHLALTPVSVIQPRCRHGHHPQAGPLRLATIALRTRGEILYLSS